MIRRHLTHALALTVLLWAEILPCSGQELEPRRWSHLPVGAQFAGVGYAYTDGDISFNPVLKIEDATVDLHTVAAKYIVAFEALGKSARLDLAQGYQDGRWEGLLDGEPASTERSGWTDTVLRFSMLLHGAPPLRGRDFATYRDDTPRETLVGAGLAVHLPTGRYYHDRLINLGSNRYTFRPQAGVLHNRGKWSVEATGSAWIFTDNDDFYNGQELENDPLYTLQGHVVYTFRPGLWWGGGVAYGYGAESTVEGDEKGDQRETVVFGFSLGCSISRRVGIKVGYIGSRGQRFIGADTDSVAVSAQLLW